MPGPANAGSAEVGGSLGHRFPKGPGSLLRAAEPAAAAGLLRGCTKDRQRLQRSGLHQHPNLEQRLGEGLEAPTNAPSVGGTESGRVLNEAKPSRVCSLRLPEIFPPAWLTSL